MDRLDTLGRQAVRCCPGGRLEVNADRSAWVCSACGADGAAFFSDEMPYRYFAEDQMNGKKDPTQWSVIDSTDRWPEVGQVQPYAFAGRACNSHATKARSLLCALREDHAGEDDSKPYRVAHRIAAAVAAWIITEHPGILDDRRVMTEDDLPRAPFTCSSCPSAFFVRKDLRLHAKTCGTAREKRRERKFETRRVGTKHPACRGAAR